MYWKERGPANTAATIEAAVKRAKELGVKNMVVASSTGATAEKLLEQGAGFKIACVTHHHGFAGPGTDEVPAEVRARLTQEGVSMLTTNHLFAGVDRALRLQFKGAYPAEIVANTLRLLSQGVKVCVEISVMALDAGLVPYGEEIIALAGSGAGADTACVIVPAHSNSLFDTEIKEIVCMPRNR